jgi:flagellar M-ring protein FliF
VRSERRVSQQTTGAGAAPGGVAGAAANQPLAPAGASLSARSQASSTMEDQIRNFDVSRTTTTTVARLPRLQRLSLAVLVDGVSGQPRAAEELTRLGDLAKRAVGFDAERGDTFDISSAPFARSDEGPAAEATPVPAATPSLVTYGAIGAGALLVLGLLFVMLRGKKRGSGGELPITPGSRIAELEAALLRDAGGLPPAPGRPALTDPAASLRDRARALATKDPTRAAHILKAWMAQEASQPSRD